MADPSIAVQGAVLTALKADAGATALVGSRVYDFVRKPDGETFPYLRVDITQAVEADDACGRHWDVFVSVHCWSRSQYRGETLNMIGAVRSVIDADLTLIGFTLIERQFLQSRILDDPDGLTHHGIVEQRYFVSAP